MMRLPAAGQALCAGRDEGGGSGLESGRGPGPGASDVDESGGSGKVLLVLALFLFWLLARILADAASCIRGAERVGPGSLVAARSQHRRDPD